MQGHGQQRQNGEQDLWPGRDLGPGWLDRLSLRTSAACRGLHEPRRQRASLLGHVIVFCPRLCFCFVGGWPSPKDVGCGETHRHLRGADPWLAARWAFLREDGIEGSKRPSGQLCTEVITCVAGEGKEETYTSLGVRPPHVLCPAELSLIESYRLCSKGASFTAGRVATQGPKSQGGAGCEVPSLLAPDPRSGLPLKCPRPQCVQAGCWELMSGMWLDRAGPPGRGGPGAAWPSEGVCCPVCGCLTLAPSLLLLRAPRANPCAQSASRAWHGGGHPLSVIWAWVCPSGHSSVVRSPSSSAPLTLPLWEAPASPPARLSLGRECLFKPGKWSEASEVWLPEELARAQAVPALTSRHV